MQRDMVRLLLLLSCHLAFDLKALGSFSLPMISICNLYTFVGTAVHCSRLMHSGVWRMSTCVKVIVDEDALVSVSG